MCHQFRGLSRFDEETSRVRLFFTNPDYIEHRLGPHARLACTDCHERSEVGSIPHAPASPVDCTRQCHLADPTGLAREFSHNNIPPMLERSAHSPEILSKVNNTGGPLLNAGQAQCLYCHDEPLFRDPTGVFPRFSEVSSHIFDRCDVCHVEKVPADIEYYTRHIASRFQPARSTLETAQVCAVCHADPLVMQEHELTNTIASYVRSFHGKAALLGDQTTASCISCHVAAGENAHLMIGQKDARSSVNVANRADSCQSTSCHPGAAKTIGENAVHLDIPTAQGSAEYILAAIFIVLTIFTFGPSAMLVLLDLLQAVVGREHHADLRSRELAENVMRHPEGKERLKRFTPRHRVAHWILSILFTLLVLTGFPLKFPETAWAAALINSFGGLSIARVVHHWSGILLVLGFMLHIVDIFVVFLKRANGLKDEHGHGRWFKAWTSLPMWISPTDLRKSAQLFAYLLFLRKERPSFGRFSPAEKF
ncbi:MAG: cytochrome b/b6 domain-containing protein [Planctomycetes bacterium]|nr:cytochrome b/b6 domain-containing protein [Planctomycetota bacterium]